MPPSFPMLVFFKVCMFDIYAVACSFLAEDRSYHTDRQPIRNSRNFLSFRYSRLYPPQEGLVLLPCVVTMRSSLPSTSIMKIWGLPLRFD